MTKPSRRPLARRVAEPGPVDAPGAAPAVPAVAPEPSSPPAKAAAKKPAGRGRKTAGAAKTTTKTPAKTTKPTAAAETAGAPGEQASNGSPRLSLTDTYIEQLTEMLGANERRKQRAVSLPEGLLDRARSAVYYAMRHPDEASNLSELFARAVLWEVVRLERKYNDGQPWPAVHRLPSGPGQEGIERMKRRRADELRKELLGEE